MTRKNSLLLFFCILIAIGWITSCSGAEGGSNETGWKETLNSDGRQMKTMQDMGILIGFLREFGVDISYGDDGGTIFSMVDASLTRIISSLASGNVEGFLEIPLIEETLSYVGLSAEDIVIRPNETPEGMEAVDSYRRTYGEYS